MLCINIQTSSDISEYNFITLWNDQQTSLKLPKFPWNNKIVSYCIKIVSHNTFCINEVLTALAKGQLISECPIDV